MNANLQKTLIKALLALGGVLWAALLSAFSMFFGKVLEPAIAWISFKVMGWTAKITRSKNLKELYEKMKEGYEGNK